MLFFFPYVVPESLGSLKNCVIILEMVISNCVVFIFSFSCLHHEFQCSRLPKLTTFGCLLTF